MNTLSTVKDITTELEAGIKKLVIFVMGSLGSTTILHQIN